MRAAHQGVRRQGGQCGEGGGASAPGCLRTAGRSHRRTAYPRRRAAPPPDPAPRKRCARGYGPGPRAHPENLTPRLRTPRSFRLRHAGPGEPDGLARRAVDRQVRVWCSSAAMTADMVAMMMGAENADQPVRPSSRQRGLDRRGITRIDDQRPVGGVAADDPQIVVVENAEPASHKLHRANSRSRDDSSLKRTAWTVTRSSCIPFTRRAGLCALVRAPPRGVRCSAGRA